MKVKKIVIVLMCLLVSVVSCSPNAESIYSSKFDSGNSSGNIGSSDILHPSSSGYPPISSPSSSTDTNSDSSSNSSSSSPSTDSSSSSLAPVIHTAEIRYDGTISNLYEGNTKQFYLYVDESPVYSASWTSSNTNVASIDSNGLLTAVSPGSTEITGSFYIDDQVVCDSLFVTVLHRTIYPDSISLNSSNVELKIDETYQLNATVSPENADDKSVEWSSSDDTVVTIDSNGLVHAISRGEAVITATTCNDLVATCKIKVIEPSITITNVETTLYEQDTLQLETSLIDLPFDSVITYVSDNDSIATINSNGVVTAVHEGQVTITASVVYNGTTYEDSITLNILHLVIDPLSVSLNATNLELDVNDTYQFIAEVLPENADDKTVTWSSTDEDVIEVDDNGLAIAVGAGEAKVVATLSNGINCSCNITVYKPTLSINPVEDTTLLVDDTIQLSVELYRISSAVIDWTSNNDQIATVDANGLVTALKAGNVVIEASCTYKGTLYKDSISFRINQPSVEIDEMSDDPIFIGDTVTLSCSTQYLDGKITWSSSDEAIATINDDGVLTAISEGEVTIEAACGKYSDSITITVNNRDTYYTDGLYFMRLNDSYYVSAYLGDSKIVYIPSTYNELPVSMIGVNAFKGNSSIEQVFLTKIITSISDNAFYDCGSLTSIVIPDNVTSIGSYAFYDCDNLASIVIPDNVTSIGSYAFWGCNSLTSVIFGENSKLAGIGSYAFQYCGSLTSIVIPDNVNSIGSYVFNVCGSLASIVIPDSVTNIGSDAFAGCNSLTIYCEAPSKPSGWDRNWNSSNRPVVWDYKEN